MLNREAEGLGAQPLNPSNDTTGRYTIPQFINPVCPLPNKTAIIGAQSAPKPTTVQCCTSTVGELGAGVCAAHAGAALIESRPLSF